MNNSGAMKIAILLYGLAEILDKWEPDQSLWFDGHSLHELRVERHNAISSWLRSKGKKTTRITEKRTNDFLAAVKAFPTFGWSMHKEANYQRLNADFNNYYRVQRPREMLKVSEARTAITSALRMLRSIDWGNQPSDLLDGAWQYMEDFVLTHVSIEIDFDANDGLIGYYSQVTFPIDAHNIASELKHGIGVAMIRVGLDVKESNPVVEYAYKYNWRIPTAVGARSRMVAHNFALIEDRESFGTIAALWYLGGEKGQQLVCEWRKYIPSQLNALLEKFAKGEIGFIRSLNGRDSVFEDEDYYDVRVIVAGALYGCKINHFRQPRFGSMGIEIYYLERIWQEGSGRSAYVETFQYVSDTENWQRLLTWGDTDENYQ